MDEKTVTIAGFKQEPITELEFLLCDELCVVEEAVEKTKESAVSFYRNYKMGQLMIVGLQSLVSTFLKYPAKQVAFFKELRALYVNNLIIEQLELYLTEREITFFVLDQLEQLDQVSYLEKIFACFKKVHTKGSLVFIFLAPAQFSLLHNVKYTFTV